ncbi:hypothetical protein I302_100309 [Kwoniella bestiolae CBS 10118]|uniref:Uncharacterized protein n=1 Tax=Kwoniella bestiolae CBS 10118 TaxID=1296100 RepID=A0A1B9G4P3_9TREE|nr:hypothetical protein I302_03681 [Kwoniella bestiolae CBS 10118]OCF26004.1 hypothetical protein I302_03681 [Kwoniella bestiolae CBS 10118]
MSSTYEPEISNIYTQLAARSDYDQPREFDPDPNAHGRSNHSSPISSRSGSTINQPPKSMQFSIYCDETVDPNSYSVAESAPSFDDKYPSVDTLFPTSFGLPSNNRVEIEQPTPIRLDNSAAHFERFVSTAANLEPNNQNQSLMADNPSAFVGENKSSDSLESGVSPHPTTTYQYQEAPPPYSASNYYFNTHHDFYNPPQGIYPYGGYSSYPNPSSESVNSQRSNRSRWSDVRSSFMKTAKSIVDRFSSTFTGRGDRRLDYDKSFTSDSDDSYRFDYEDMTDGDRSRVSSKGGCSYVSNVQVKGPRLVW